MATELHRIAAEMTRLPKEKARPLAQLCAWWKASAILTSGVAADVINSLLEHARAAAAAIRAWGAAVVDVALAAVDVAATVFVTNNGRSLPPPAPARRSPPPPRPRPARPPHPGLDDGIVTAAIATHCLDISEPQTSRGLQPGYCPYTACWALSGLPARRPPTPAPDPDQQPPADSGALTGPRHPEGKAREWEIPRLPLNYERAVLAGAAVREKLRSATATVRGRAYDVVAHQQAAMPEPHHPLAAQDAVPAFDAGLPGAPWMSAAHAMIRPHE